MMKHLQKITISNIRRFAEDVQIEIGMGATIFHAPNGLGKTAIFEAIELALTGKVKRLLFPPEPLIKDNCQNAFIRLDFDEGEYCEAKFNKGSHPIIAGHHQSLFGTVENQDLPFLLQLTHFLNQRGENWFVQADGEVAGSQLDHLSIGREAAEVNKKIPSAKKAARNLLEQYQRNFDEADTRLKNWSSLLAKRTESNPNIPSDLISRSSLMERINQVIVQIRDAKLAANDDLLQLKIQLGEVKTLASSILENLNKRSILLEGLNIVVSDFNAANEIFNATRIQLQNSRANKAQLESDIDASKQNISRQLNLIVQKETEIRKQQEIKFEIDNLARINRDLATLNDSLPSLKERININTAESTAAKDRLDKASNAIAANQLFEAKQDLNKKALQQINQFRSTLSKWIANTENLRHHKESLLPTILSNQNEQSIALANLTEQEHTLELRLQEIQTTFTSLNNTSDNIKAAIGVIISGYPADRGDCPVCGEVYTPTELHRRMSAALDSIDPNLKAASENLDAAKRNLDDVRISIINFQETNRAASNDLNWINSQISKLEELEVQFLAEFKNCNNQQDADAFINNLQQEYDSEAATLKNDITVLPARPSNQQILELTDSSNTANNNLIAAVERLNHVNERVIELVERRTALENTISQFEQTSGINELVLRLESELNSIKNVVESLRKVLNNQQLNLDNSNDEITRLEITNSQTSTRLSNLRAQWIQARLTGDPNTDPLEQAKRTVTASIERWEQNANELESINLELTRWQVLEDNEKIEQEISLTRGELTEADFGVFLTESLEKCRQSLEAITSKTQALNTFAGHLESELLTVHERIRSINPLWKKLLKRIVIDPRFAETTLDNFNYYKKQHANVIVPVNGTNTLVSQVASEAQLTDIQLTFLLAMAEKYQWSPWKALLLDDPTQHHDLVHASAVFDLLRDYISEYNFQILMATHDTVQARFLLRKLQNDGIPVRLYTLYAADGGVNVRLN